MKWRVAIVTLLVVGGCAMARGTAALGQVQSVTDLTGTLGDTAFKIRVPSNWNGTLLVFAHGIQITPPAPVVAPPPVEAQLLQAGYALAGSGFGNSYKDGVLRTHQLTGFFLDTVEDSGYTRLADLGLLRAEVDHMLEYMNEHANIGANRAARTHLAQWGSPSGRLRRPVVTMHG